MSAAPGLEGRIGEELGVSDWLTIDQARISAFADATNDHQWIHVDPERAAGGPFGSTIAHGYLTLSLVAGLSAGLFGESGFAAIINYGLEKVRFITPVRVGSRIRLRAKLVSIEPKGPGRRLMTTENTIEIDGEAKPALVAVGLAMGFE